MDSESNVIPLFKKDLLSLTHNEDPMFKNDQDIELSTIEKTEHGWHVISPQELVKRHPEAAKIMFDLAREQYHSAVETMGMLEDALGMEPHIADIIDARDPEIWKKKTNKL